MPTLGVVAIPVLIHLINMMRHKRVEWAAMEFLLASQKKHRTWVLFKQLVLLLMRMLALAAVVCLVAQPKLRSQLGGLLGGVHTHHIVLIDDSYSMSDRWADTDAFAEAKRVAEQIGLNAAREDRPQSFSLLRFSRAALPDGAGKPDAIKLPIGGNFSDELEKLLGELNVSQTAAGPLPALKAIDKLLGDGADEQRIIYLISDFRARQWNDPTELHEELLRLGESGADVRLVNCVDRERPNLAIGSLAPAAGIRAAGVPWFMEVAVRNYGPDPVEDVAVTLSEDGHGRPSVVIGEVAAGRSSAERFPVHFPVAGPHDVTAQLPGDAVEIDNHRYETVPLPVAVPVLLVDGGADARDAKYVGFALSPGDSIRTGVQPTIETPRFLALKPLDNYRAVCLLNVGRLEASAVAALEKYISAGGGLAIFLGDRADVRFYNDELYRDGKGLFPAPLEREEELLVDRLEPAPDVQVENHFIFRVFAAEQNTFLQTVTVERYFAMPRGWRPAADSATRIIARLRNGAPLMIERAYGKGCVIAFLSSAGPTWNNWARNPSFVVAMQDLQAYLTQRDAESAGRTVGSPLVLKLNPAVYKPEVRFTFPERSGRPPLTIDASQTPDGVYTAALLDTPESGFYEARLIQADGAPEIRRYAVNVDPAEGNLATVDGSQLAAKLAGIKYKYLQASSFQAATEELAGYNLSDALLYGLVLLLIAEQIFAWSASYHPKQRSRSAAGGGA